MRSRVMMVTDCGVSFRVCAPFISVGALSRWAETTMPGNWLTSGLAWANAAGLISRRADKPAGAQDGRRDGKMSTKASLYMKLLLIINLIYSM